ncbi:MAG: branched-chain amino acid transaminase [Vicinamibacterales bacterium]
MSFPGASKVWMNGKLVNWADAKIHVATHVIHYGSGVFEGIRCYDTPRGSACLRLEAHMRRLLDSAKIYRMAPPLSLTDLCEAVLDTIRANDVRACYIRPLIYRGYETLGVNPLTCPVDTAIMVWEWGAYLGSEALEKGVDVCVSSWNRPAPNTFPALAKASANYANAQLIKMEAIGGGFSEGIALDTNGFVSEGSGQNIFVVRDRVIYTSPMAAGILPGITRDSVITLAQQAGYRVREEFIPRELLYIADEVFFVGTAVEITPVRSIDRIAIGNGARGPVTAAMQRAFFDVIQGRTPDSHGWLSFVYPQEASLRTSVAGTTVQGR